MSKVTDGSYGSHGVPVGADWVVGVKASGPNVKELLLSDLRQFSNMAQATGTDADTTMAINTLYVVDMSAWATADRTYTLPATAAVGDRIGIAITSGDASHELVITAASGDTLNGIAGGTEWSRLFISNEFVIMRCVAANATWVIEHDGRIAQNGSLTRTTAQTLGSGAFTKILGATIEINKGDCVDTTNSVLIARRAGNYLCGAFCRLDLNATKSIVVGLGKNGTVVSRGQGMSALTPGTIGVGALCPIALAAGDTLDMQVFHDQGANRDTSTVSDSVPRVYFTEVL